MAHISFYREGINLASNEAIVEAFLNSLADTNRGFDFYVDWNKVKSNIEHFKIEIGILSSLAGSSNPSYELKELIEKYPEVVKVLPLIIAVRDRSLKVLEETSILQSSSSFEFTPKSQYSEAEINHIVRFCEKTGILELMKIVQILRDYLLGVEVGLDTHARKNRSGKAMEDVIEPILSKILSRGYLSNIVTQKTFAYFEDVRSLPVPAQLRDRKFDAVCVKDSKPINIEVNFYGGGGSKPQEIVDSYINRRNELKGAGWHFIWITDGPGWKTGVNQIRKGIEEIEFVLNLRFVKQGFLEYILKNI